MKTLKNQDHIVFYRPNQLIKLCIEENNCTAADLVGRNIPQLLPATNLPPPNVFSFKLRAAWSDCLDNYILRCTNR